MLSVSPINKTVSDINVFARHTLKNLDKNDANKLKDQANPTSSNNVRHLFLKAFIKVCSH